MTVSTTSRLAGPFTGTGAAAALPFGFKVFDENDIVVTVADQPLALGADYAVTINADQDAAPGGSVAITALAYASGATVYVGSATEARQQTVLGSQTVFYPKVIEAALDRSIVLHQEAADALARAPLLPLAGGVAGKYPVVLPGGGWGFVSGTGADAGLRTDLAASTGLSLIGVAQAGVSLPLAAADAVLRSVAVHVHLFRRTAETDDTLAFARALATGLPVRFVAGSGSGTAGVYVLGSTEIPAGAVIIGDGPGKSILQASATEAGGTNSGNEWGMLTVTSGSSTTTIDNITIRDLTVQDQVASLGFLEHRHLMRFRGVRDMTIQNVRFVGFRGDGLVLTAEAGDLASAANYRHNYNVLIHGCVFDGINKNNRNGVSVIDCLGLKVASCTFRNIARSDMPGAIDFEPNGYPYYQLGRCSVINCDFDNIGGNTGVICVFIPGGITTTIQDFIFAGNRVRNSGTDFFFQRPGLAPNDTSNDHRIVVRDHEGVGGVSMFNMSDAIKGVTLERSRWTDYAGVALVGYTGAAQRPHTVAFRDNVLTRVGTAANAGNGNTAMTVFRADRLTISGNEFVDCGNGEGTSFSGGVYFAGGSSTNVTIERNRVRDVTGRTKVAVCAQSHTFSASTNFERGNRYGALANAFQSAISDVAQTWFPVFDGSAGVSDQGSYYWIEGRTCHFQVYYASTGGNTVQLAHSLPLAPSTALYGPSGQTAGFECDVDGAGAPTTKRIFCQLNPSVDIGANKGSVRFFQRDNTTGAGSAFVLANSTAASIRVRGSYQIKDLPGG